MCWEPSSEDEEGASAVLDSFRTRARARAVTALEAEAADDLLPACSRESRNSRSWSALHFPVHRLRSSILDVD